MTPMTTASRHVMIVYLRKMLLSDTPPETDVFSEFLYEHVMKPGWDKPTARTFFTKKCDQFLGEPDAMEKTKQGLLR